MTILRYTSIPSDQAVSRLTIGRAATILFVLTLSAAIYLAWDQVEGLGTVGYPAIFLMSLIGSAAFLFPRQASFL